MRSVYGEKSHDAVRAPTGRVVVANGALLGVRPVGGTGGARSETRWREAHPIPTDIMVIGAGPLAKFDLPPMPKPDFFSRHVSGKPGTHRIDASRGICEFVFQDTGEVMHPCMMHFAANEAPLVYHWQLAKLFRKFGVKEPGLLRSAVAR